MKDILLTPHAPAFVESLRAIGYSTEAAFADIIDNSISAGSATIRLLLSPADNLCAFIDDGAGMSANELTEAMRHGARSPADIRPNLDLGRFGLGLKTASLSQCRRLTVLSKRSQDHLPHARIWDLDTIADRKDWVLLQPETEEELLAIPYCRELAEARQGTVVLWQKLDRFAGSEHDLTAAFDTHSSRIASHVALVYHRYLERTARGSALRILINDRLIEPYDPYLRTNAATQKLPVDRFEIDGSSVTVSPFILPHLSKLSQRERRAVIEENGGRNLQGFYVYRNQRLIVHSTWFRLARGDELSKLARVQVDIPNTLDHLWMIDVRKSSAFPPAQVRDNLKRTVDRIVGRSKAVFCHRGRLVGDSGVQHVWNRLETRSGTRYQINREHPLLRTLRARMDPESGIRFDQILRLVEDNYPLYPSYSDVATSAIDDSVLDDRSQFVPLIRQLLEFSETLDAAGKQALLAEIPKMEPFFRNSTLAIQILEEQQKHG
jgi:Histidine kinase-, DNA gyrase B-, and HSP90-like ATPase